MRKGYLLLFLLISSAAIAQNYCDKLSLRCNSTSISLYPNEKYVPISITQLKQFDSLVINDTTFTIVQFILGGNDMETVNLGPKLSNTSLSIISHLKPEKRFFVEGFVLMNKNGIKFKCENMHWIFIIKEQ